MTLSPDIAKISISCYVDFIPIPKDKVKYFNCKFIDTATGAEIILILITGGIFMYDIIQIKAQLTAIAEKLEEEEPLLTKLDGLSGDGDLGITATKISLAVNEICKLQPDSVDRLFMKLGMEINKQAPSTMGTLLAAGSMALGKAFRGQEALSDSDVAEIPSLLAAEIMKRGHANPGDKTILDALVPMAETVRSVFDETGDIREAYHRGAESAAAGADSTCGMLAKTGRASWIAERTKDNPDGGAVLCASIAGLYR